MPQYDVVGDALLDAAMGVINTVAALRVCPVGQVDPGAGAVGHAELAAAVGEFCSRWQRGLTNLVDDGDQYATRLRDAANAYLGVDVVVAAALRADGP